MMWIKRAARWISNNPIHSILTILAISMVWFSIYIQSPFYIGPLVESMLFGVIPERNLLGIIYLIPSIIVFTGLIIKSDRVIRAGSFWMFLIYLFATLLRFTIFQFTPFTLFLLTCGLVAGVARLTLEVRHGDN